MNILFNNRDPIYLQVVRYFKAEIAAGRLEAGKEIPSRRELAALLKINPNTAQRSYKEMEEQGLIVTEGNSPSRITSDETILKSIRQELIEDAVNHFIESIRGIDIPLEELLERVRDKYDAERSKRQEDEV